MNQNEAPVVTIDGASGTGKGVVGQLVAKQLGWHLLDSGALYRVLAMAAIKHSVAFDNEPVLEVLAGHLHVEFVAAEIGDHPHIFLEEQDVTEAIRTEQIGNIASKVGALPLVRLALLERQRVFCQLPGLVTDGRDMGTVVFPNAAVKIFLTASPEERANRRYKQLKQKGIDVNLANLIEDAVCIDTDHLTIDQVVQRIMSEIGKWQTK
jgi:cytidylate kinase